MKELEHELKQAFTSFYHFSLSLIQSLDKKNGNLRFAVVNIQIALELFLKYYFIKSNMPERVFKDPQERKEFRDFSTVLSSYFTVVRDEHLAPKKHLLAVMESRNSIVHKGKFNEWNDELAEYIITCAFFIQNISKKNFDETLLSPHSSPHRLSRNRYWKAGAERIALQITKENGAIPFECPHCAASALISKELFSFDEHFSENLQCLACLVDVDIEVGGTLIKCCSCDSKSFFVDTLNQQPGGNYCGKCLYCGESLDVMKCSDCSELYFPDLSEHKRQKPPAANYCDKCYSPNFGTSPD